ncbi:MAG: hypothetical protein M0P47_04830 [Bacteroidales bacterium]|nr:hypothetical protein [Bacteroidales bacterium]
MKETETLENLLGMEMSRRNTDLVANLVSQKQELLNPLMEIFLRNENPVSRRAAWVIDVVSKRFPEQMEPFLHSIVESLPKFQHDGLKRHALHILYHSQLPDERDIGILLKICFDWLISPQEAVAAKVYCMDMLYRISEFEPAIRQELADSIEWRLHEETSGFRSHGIKILKKIKGTQICSLNDVNSV